jgi:threonine dehydrogenase-like Zn-dependent dehydrogenase
MSGLGGPPLYCEFVTRKQDSVARAPVHVPFERLAMSELLGCVHRACNKVPQLAGKSVLVSGCGPAGLAAIQICQAFSCRSCLAVDVDSERLLLAEKLGADATIDARDAAAMERGSREGVDIVIECSGNHQALQQAFHFAREAVVIFSYSEGVLPVPSWPLFDHELTIYNSKWLTNDDLQSVVDMVAAGKIRTAEMISVVSDFNHYPDLAERIGRGEIIKAVMIP